jgi:FtsZ-interacting cell division protein ZipA
MTPTIIVILAALLIIGIVRSTREKAQSEQVKDSPVQEQEETSYQISQEVDQSNYQEVYASEETQPEVEVKKTPAPKKAPVKKEAPAKKSAPKKPATKKTPAKKPTK